MGSPENSADEPLTPTSRLFLHKETSQVIHLAVGFKNPIDVQALKDLARVSSVMKQPRFCSLVVRDSNGMAHWRRTEVEIDRQFVVVHGRVGTATDDEVAVNEYLADLAMSTEFAADKPLWEIHVLTAHRCMILRIHHALGDGIALGSVFSAFSGQVDKPGSTKPAPSQNPNQKSIIEFIKMVWFTIVFVFGYIKRSLWVRDPKSPITGGEGVELWPRKLATARFWLDDMKFIKRALPGSTVNDVLFGVISLGLCRYMDQRWPGSMQVGQPMTGLAMVNLRKQPDIQEHAKSVIQKPDLRSNNRFGVLLLPIHYQGPGTGPLEHITRAKKMLDRKKNSMEAIFSYWFGDVLMSRFGSKMVSSISRKVCCNTTFTISNLVGPAEETVVVGNPVTYIRVNISGTPHSLIMHMLSYAGRADLQVLVAKDIIPDPEFLAQCFETAILDMKNAAEPNIKIRD